MIFHKVRMYKKDGGVAVTAKPELNPVLVSEAEGDIYTADINTKNICISCTSAYGPQATATTDAETDFWSYLSNAASSARNAGKGFILQGDLNATLRPCIIPGDLKVFFLSQNNLTVVNSLSLCKDVVTRIRLLVTGKL